MFKKSEILSVKDSLGKAYLTGKRDSSFMKTVENEIPPIDLDKKSGSETAKGDANASLDKGAELAQEDQKGDDTDYNSIFTTVQVSASPPGGMNAFRKQIASSFRLPEVDETTTGTVVAKFVVGLDGAISDIVILKESPTGLGLGKEATRILSRSPKWTPGVYNLSLIHI